MVQIRGKLRRLRVGSHLMGKRWRNLWICILTILSSSSLYAQAQSPLPDCEGKKIAILDLSDLASAGNYPRCNLDEVVQVNIGNGIAYSTKHEIEGKAPHMYGTHSAPWFLNEGIKSSKYYTTNLEEASIIFVYDYCYYIWWLGDVHSYGRDHLDGPGDHLLQAYNTMMQLPIWRNFDGGNFAFYDPHPGFMAGKAAWPVGVMKCQTFRNAIHMIVDTPMRNVCPAYWLIPKIMVTPYVPNPLDIRDPTKYLRQQFRSAEDRPLLAYSRARCGPYEPPSRNTGKLMRYWFSFIEWGKLPHVDVRCTDTEIHSEGHQEYSAMFEKMRSAKFCPAFPGDAASTRRLSEIFLAGCVPVFLGPPYHSMPFGETVPYADLGIFFNIKNNSMWLKEGSTQWKLHPTIRSVHETEAQWWVPDVDVPQSNYIEVDQPSEVLAHLEGVPTVELNRKLKLMHEYGSRFSFQQKITQPPNAVNSLLSGMCIKQNQFPAKPALPKMITR